MMTIDRRTRLDGDVIDLNPDTFLYEHVPALPDDRFLGSGSAARRLGLPPLTLDVDGDLVTFASSDDRLTVVGGGSGGGLFVSLDRTAFSELVQDVVSTFALNLTGRADIVEGELSDFLEWEPILRCLLDGRPVHEAGALTLLERDGSPLRLDRSFRLDDDHAEIGHFLTEAGFLHLTGVFTPAEMEAVSAELDDAVAAAQRDDGASWWARTSDDEWYPARILGFNRRSAALRDLLQSERFRAIGTFTDDDFRFGDPDVDDVAEGLLKKVGVVEGISDVSWHKDCAMGGHSRGCCSLIVGISITGAGPENGELGAIAASHRANVPLLGTDALDLPRRSLPTKTGDVTVHCSCTFHMSRPPLSAERRVVYTGFGLASRPGDQRPTVDPEQARRDRADLSNHVQQSQHQHATGTRLADFDL